MLKRGKEFAAKQSQAANMLLSYATDALVNKVQAMVTPTELMSPEQLESTRLYVDESKTKVKDLATQLQKILIYMVAALAALYGASYAIGLITPLLEIALATVAVLSAAVLSVNIVYLSPTFVKLKLNDLHQASRVTIEEIPDEDKAINDQSPDLSVGYVVLTSDQDVTQIDASQEIAQRTPSPGPSSQDVDATSNLEQLAIKRPRSKSPQVFS